MSQCTHVTDGWTDGQTEFSSLDRVCIPCSEVKMNKDRDREITYYIRLQKNYVKLHKNYTLTQKFHRRTSVSVTIT